MNMAAGLYGPFGGMRLTQRLTGTTYPRISYREAIRAGIPARVLRSLPCTLGRFFGFEYNLPVLKSSSRDATVSTLVLAKELLFNARRFAATVDEFLFKITVERDHLAAKRDAAEAKRNTAEKRKADLVEERDRRFKAFAAAAADAVQKAALSTPPPDAPLGGLTKKERAEQLVSFKNAMRKAASVALDAFIKKTFEDSADAAEDAATARFEEAHGMGPSGGAWAV
jgi:hypothetical protein